MATKGRKRARISHILEKKSKNAHNYNFFARFNIYDSCNMSITTRFTENNTYFIQITGKPKREILYQNTLEKNGTIVIIIIYFRYETVHQDTYTYSQDIYRGIFED